MLQKILQNIGLTKREAKIYLAATQLGQSPASHIAKKAGINRVTTYDTIEKLLQKGFITKHKRKGMLYFAAVDPEVISLDFHSKARDFRKSLPDLKRLKGETAHPQIQYFEGLNGIKRIYLDTLSSQTEILNYADSEGIRTHWPEHDEEYIKQRVKRGIYLRGICADDDYGKTQKAKDWECNREIRLVPKEEFDFSNEINIYDNKVAIVSYGKDLIGMIIENRDIANTQRTIFKMAWDFAK